MRKIVSKQDQAKKDKTKQLVIGLILIFVMFFSVLGYSFGGAGDEENTNSKINYNGFEFVSQNGYWFLGLGDFVFTFKKNPNQVLSINSEINLLNSYTNKPLYVSSLDYDSKLEIYRNFDPRNNPIVQRIQDACYEDCDGDLPIKTCEDNFIIIQESEETKIEQNGSCVFITGPKENLPDLTDEFLFKVLGVK